jgi:hypothetical protein
MIHKLAMASDNDRRIEGVLRRDDVGAIALSL